MSWTIEQLAEEMARRRLSQSPLVDRMIELRDRYNADAIVPVPDTDDDIPISNLTPLLIADAVDNTALYAAQVMPDISVPPIDPAKSTGVRSADFAQRRRKSLEYVWDQSWIELLLGRMYRHLAGYATSALVVELDFDNKMPMIRLRDPLTSYPEPKAPEDLSPPRNVGFIWGRSLDWLHANFPETRDRLPRGSGFAVAQSTEGEMWDVVEWMDEEEIVVGVLGPRDSVRSWTTEPLRWVMELQRFKNPIGKCPAVVPRRVTMDKIISQLSNLSGHADVMAKLYYLDIRATERSIFPERFVLAKAGQNPRLLDGEWHDGASGEMNIVLDADQVGNLPATSDPNARQVMDRLERNFKVSSGQVPQQTGETYGALRTGRGIDTLMGAALDPKTAELHRIGERYLTSVNELCLEAFRARWPSKTYAVGWDGESEFIPGTHVEKIDGRTHVRNRVQYPIPGVDDVNATQVVGQMLGARMISQRDARRMHPLIKDPDGTERQLLVESFEEIAAQSFLQRAQAGGIPPEDWVAVIGALYEGKRLHEAIAIADEAAKTRQAAQPPEPQEEQVLAPEQMPGLANLGEGGGMGPGPEQAPVIQEPGQDLENLKALVAAMQSPGGS